MKMMNEWFAAAFKLYQGQTIVKKYGPWPNPVHNVTVTLTAAQVIAAHVTPITLVPALPGLKIKVLDFATVASGTFDNFTNVLIQDSASTPVVAVTLPVAVANLGIAKPTTTNVVLGAGFLVGLTANKALQLKTSGGTATAGGTSLKVSITYTTEE